MWKAVRFEGTEERDPLEEMADFVNKRGLQPGQFQFSVASDDEGFQYCVMLYAEPKTPSRGAAVGGPHVATAGERPSRFASSTPPAGSRKARGGPDFKGERSGPRFSGGGGAKGGGTRPGRGGPGGSGRPPRSRSGGGKGSSGKRRSR